MEKERQRHRDIYYQSTGRYKSAERELPRKEQKDKKR